MAPLHPATTPLTPSAETAAPPQAADATAPAVDATPKTNENEQPLTTNEQRQPPPPTAVDDTSTTIGDKDKQPTAPTVPIIGSKADASAEAPPTKLEVA